MRSVRIVPFSISTPDARGASFRPYRGPLASRSQPPSALSQRAHALRQIAGTRDVLRRQHLLLSRAGYFSHAADVTPLLTWSLSVEEQFYIAFPLLLLLVSRLGRRARLGTMWALFVLSLALSVYLVKHDTPAAFFLFPPRAWELILGGLLAARAIPDVPERYREPIAISAVTAILIAAFTYHEDTPFPGLRALIPCLAAAALIHVGAKGSTRVGTLLASAPFVALGLISYSLYLWHWPLITFYKAYTGATSDPRKAVALPPEVSRRLCSWRFIEQPFEPEPPGGASSRIRRCSRATCSCAFSSLPPTVSHRYPDPTTHCGFQIRRRHELPHRRVLHRCQSARRPDPLRQMPPIDKAKTS